MLDGTDRLGVGSVAGLRGLSVAACLSGVVAGGGISCDAMAQAMREVEAGRSGERGVGASTQASVDRALRRVDELARVERFGVVKADDGSGFVALLISTMFVQVDLEIERVTVSDRVVVDVEVVESAQRAGLRLNIGDEGALNLGGPGVSDGQSSMLVLRVSGSEGAAIFEFASGTPLFDVRNAFAARSDETGVVAVVSAIDGIRLESPSFGSDEFVSVEVIDDGGISGATGIQTFNDDDFREVGGIGSSVVTFAAAATSGEAVVDLGQDIGILLDGRRVAADGNRLQLTPADDFGFVGSFRWVFSQRRFGPAAVFEVGVFQDAEAGEPVEASSAGDR